jgi:nitroreductase
MNEVLSTINSMRSVQSFSTKDIPDKDLEAVLNACVKAASASNRQSYSIVVVRDRQVIEGILGCGGNRALVFCVDFNRIVDTADHLRCSFSVNLKEFVTGCIDTILVAQNAAVAAKSIGIDSLLTNSVHRGDIDRIYKQFNLPEKYCFPLISLILGYSTEAVGKGKGRIKGKGIIHLESYHRLTDEELDELVKTYDAPENNLWATVYPAVVKDKSFSHYLEWYFKAWAVRDVEALPRIEKVLRRAGFI